MWLTRDALALSSLSGLPSFASVHSSRVRAGGKGVRLSTQHTLNTAATLCSAQALHLPGPGRGWILCTIQGLAGSWNLCRISETQCGISRQLGISQMWFLVMGTDHIAPFLRGPTPCSGHSTSPCTLFYNLPGLGLLFYSSGAEQQMHRHR